MPPWGPAAAALGALMAVAASAGGLAAYTHIHYRLGTDGWTGVEAAILLVFLVGYILAGSVLLRRPGVAGPGLVGGLLVAAAWLAVGGFTFNRWLNSLGSDWWLLFLAPIVVGVGGTLWGGSAAVGRRAARLATVIAALGIYLYGVLAVAVLGAAGHDPSDGWTAAQVVGDQLGNQAVFYLMALSLMTASIGWAAAAATARLRHAQPTIAAPHPTPPAIANGRAAGHTEASVGPEAVGTVPEGARRGGSGAGTPSRAPIASNPRSRPAPVRHASTRRPLGARTRSCLGAATSGWRAAVLTQLAMLKPYEKPRDRLCHSTSVHYGQDAARSRPRRDRRQRGESSLRLGPGFPPLPTPARSAARSGDSPGQT
jgi:hypothetical protein